MCTVYFHIFKFLFIGFWLLFACFPIYYMAINHVITQQMLSSFQWNCFFMSCQDTYQFVMHLFGLLQTQTPSLLTTVAKFALSKLMELWKLCRLPGLLFKHVNNKLLPISYASHGARVERAKGPLNSSLTNLCSMAQLMLNK